MNFNSFDDLTLSGFLGFRSVSDLQNSECCEVPDEPGVYLVLKGKTTHSEFLGESIGGRFKGKSATVKVSCLQDKWIDNVCVLYIGKAGPDKTKPSKATLRKRLNQYMQSGQRQRSSHWGGRYIWQLQVAGDLVVCWKVMPPGTASKEEGKLIREFKAAYGKLPFANLVTPSARG